MAQVKAGFVVVAIAVVATVALGFVSYQRGSDASLAEPKAWEVRTLAFGKGRASLRTIWRDERISYQLRIEPYPPEVLAAVKEGPTAVQRQFKMEFLDADGFRLFSHSIDAKELALVVRPDGTVGSVEARGDRPLSRDLYQRANTWGIRWGYD
jgi:hypothetical protein